MKPHYQCPAHTAHTATQGLHSFNVHANVNTRSGRSRQGSSHVTFIGHGARSAGSLLAPAHQSGSTAPQSREAVAAHGMGPQRSGSTSNIGGGSSRIQRLFQRALMSQYCVAAPAPPQQQAPPAGPGPAGPAPSSESRAKRQQLLLAQQLDMDFERSFCTHRASLTDVCSSGSSSSDSDDHEHLTSSSSSRGSSSHAAAAWQAQEDSRLCNALLEFQQMLRSSCHSSGGNGTSISSSSSAYSRVSRNGHFTGPSHAGVDLLRGAALIARHAGASMSEASEVQVRQAVEQLAATVLAEAAAAQQAQADQESCSTSASNGSSSSTTTGTTSHGSTAADSHTSGSASGQSGSFDPSPSPKKRLQGATQAEREKGLVRALCRVMSAFQGNTLDYYAPENNLLQHVITKRTGSPTALAILYLEVASRVGLCLDPVILPSHVFLRPRVSGAPCSFLLDPFNAGQVCSQQTVEARLDANFSMKTRSISLADSLAAVRASAPATSSTLSTSSSAAAGEAPVPAPSERSGVASPAPSAEGPACSGSSNSSGGPGASCVDVLTELPAASGSALLARLVSNLRESYFCPGPFGQVRWVSSHSSSLHQPTQYPDTGSRRLGRGSNSPGQSSSSSSKPSKSMQHFSPTVWKALWMTRFMRVLAPQLPHLVRDEGLALLCLGLTKEGQVLLRTYTENLAPDAEDASRMQEFFL